jgi:hypothetical protein
MAKRTWTCCFVLAPASVGVDAKYCGAKVSFKVEKDQDANKRRKYNAFCDKHEAEVAAVIYSDDWSE